MSSDRDQAAFEEYHASMPWLALEYDEDERKSELSSLFEVDGIPTLVILDENRKVITNDGRSVISKDRDCSRFPWYAVACIVASLTQLTE